MSSAGTPKVLFLMSEFNDQLSGGGRSLSFIIKHLTRIKPVVFSRSQALAREFVEESVRPDFLDQRSVRLLADGLRRLSFRRQLGILGDILKCNWQMWRYVRAHRPDIVHCNSIYDFIFAGAGVWMAATPLVFNIRATHPDDRMRWHWQIALALSSTIIVLSEEMRQYYVSRTWPALRRSVARKTKAIYSGIPLDEVSRHNRQTAEECRERLGLPRDAIIVGYVGEVSPRKGQLEFIKQVLPVACEKVEGLHFVFVGSELKGDPRSASYMEECLEAVRAAGLEERVRFAGYQSDLPTWYRAFDLTALASQFEGLPRVLLESIAFGRPVVCMDVASAREILEQHGCGFVAAKGEYNDLAHLICLLVEDAPLRAEMGRRGVEVIHNLFDIRRVAESYENVYLGLTSK
jgi:glycosyltransferase involved in cell wall biosynthesis